MKCRSAGFKVPTCHDRLLVQCQEKAHLRGTQNGKAKVHTTSATLLTSQSLYHFIASQFVESLGLIRDNLLSTLVRHVPDLLPTVYGTDKRFST